MKKTITIIVLALISLIVIYFGSIIAINIYADIQKDWNEKLNSQVEYFVSFQAWKDDTTYYYSWNTYILEHPITEGETLLDILNYIKEKENVKNVIILNYIRMN